MTPANKGLRYPAEVLSREEVAKLLDACGHGARGARNAALLTVLWRTGARINEALSLRACDVDPDARTLRILRPKGFARGKGPRVLGIDELTHRALMRLRGFRIGSTVLEDTDPMFATQTGHRLDASYVRRLLPQLAEKAGIGRRVHAHMFRHTFAFECAMENRPLPLISAALGHSRLAVTEKYLAHLAPTQVIADMQSRE